MSGSSLREEIIRLIALDGPIGLDRYMALCLSHPVHGYYMTRDPLGRRGDFITAPEISQMFGELIGLWAAQVWIEMGRPPRLVLAELGPGRGTLMADALRAMRIVPNLPDAIDLHLVETSPVLRAAQVAALPNRSHWHDTIDDLPDGPAIILANEFFDALPIRQFVRIDRGWHERLVGLDETGALAFGLSGAAEASLAAHDAPFGTVIEANPAARDIAGRLAQRLGSQGGALLLIDYGGVKTANGETFQALRQHGRADPLAHPGEADLTAHVDFSALAKVALANGGAVHGPVPQGTFLERLGLSARAAALSAGADHAQRHVIGTAARRLTDTSTASGMGSLFKAMAIADPALPDLPGFGTVTRPEPAAGPVGQETPR